MHTNVSFSYSRLNLSTIIVFCFKAFLSSLAMLKCFNRKSRPINYQYEKSKLSKTPVKASSHPLKDGVEHKPRITQHGKSNTSREVADPLKAVFDGVGDPLSMLTASNDPLSVLAIGTSEVTQTKVQKY